MRETEQSLQLAEIEPDIEPTEDALAFQEQQRLRNDHSQLENDSLRQDIGLRRRLSLTIVCLTSAMILVSTVAVFFSGWALMGFHLSDTVLVALMTNFVVQTLGIFAIMAKYAFPSK